MADKLNALKCEDGGGAAWEHTMKWNDQSGQGHGPIALTPSYTGFTGASFTVDGDTNTSTTIDGLTSTGRIVIGMTITGTDIPGGTTVATIVSGTAITISQAATGTSAGVTFTFNAAAATVYDPVMSLGYNVSVGGSKYIAGRGQAYLQIEGHYDRGASGSPWMEAFFSFQGPNAAGAARPFFFAYDVEADEMKNIDISPGPGQSLYIAHENVTGAAAVKSYRFQENILTINAPTAAETSIKIDSASGQGSQILMGADGDPVGTYPKYKITSTSAGTHHYVDHTFYDNAATPAAKTGGLHMWAPSYMNTCLMSIGTSASNGESLLNLDASLTDTITRVLSMTCDLSSTVPAVRMNGLTDGGASDPDKWMLWPKGYISVQESGGSTDRLPSTGSSTITPAWTNKPGSGTSGAATWFPMLSTTGALFWVPGFAD